jgi:hypothetical protein
MSSAAEVSTTAAADAAPRPVLSVFDGVMIITGVVIGGGIFSLPPLVAGITGSVEWMYGAWVLGAVLALVGALCYAELATAFPHAGGDYHFLTRAYGKDVSFFFAWARIMVITTGSIALLAYVFGDYMTRVLPLGAQSATIYAVAIIAVLTAVNIAGLRESSRTQNVMSGLLVAGMLLVVAAGFIAPAPAASVPAAAAAPVSAPALAAFGTALLFVLFTYGGWNEAAYISAEVKGGARSIVKVLVLALGLITVVYLLFVTALLSGLGFDGLKASKAVAADVAGRAFGPLGERMIGAIAALAALTSINATMIVSARTNYSLGADWPLFLHEPVEQRARRAGHRLCRHRRTESRAGAGGGAQPGRRQVHGRVHGAGVLVLLPAHRHRPVRAAPAFSERGPAVPRSDVSGAADRLRPDLHVSAVQEPGVGAGQQGGADRAVRDGGRTRGLDRRAAGAANLGRALARVPALLPAVDAALHLP